MEPRPFVKPVDLSAEMQEILYKRVMTAFMFAVAELEKDFGELWGEHLMNDDNFDESKLTPEQAKKYEMFLEWRKKIMDFGHKQIRLGKGHIVRQFSNLTEGKHE